MLSITDARKLIKLLDRCKEQVGEHSVEQAWRGDAMHKVGERMLAMYHRHQHENALDLIADIKTARQDLADRLAAEELVRLPARRRAG